MVITNDSTTTTIRNVVMTYLQKHLHDINVGSDDISDEIEIMTDRVLECETHGQIVAVMVDWYDFEPSECNVIILNAVLSMGEEYDD